MSASTPSHDGGDGPCNAPDAASHTTDSAAAHTASRHTHTHTHKHSTYVSEDDASRQPRVLSHEQSVAVRKACKSGDVDACLAGLAGKHVDATHRGEPHGMTAMLYAAMHGQTALCERLMAMGAGLFDPAYSPNNTALRNTALHYAAIASSAPLARLFLQHGAPVDALNKHACTPLMLAAQAGATDVVDLLLAAGADPCRSSSVRRTPGDYAVQGGFRILAERLKALAASVFEQKLAASQLSAPAQGLALSDSRSGRGAGDDADEGQRRQSSESVENRTDVVCDDVGGLENTAARCSGSLNSANISSHHSNSSSEHNSMSNVGSGSSDCGPAAGRKREARTQSDYRCELCGEALPGKWRIHYYWENLAANRYDPEDEKYLVRFLQSPAVRAMDAHPRFYYHRLLLNKKLHKEATESWAMIEAIETTILPELRRLKAGRPFKVVFFDLACGKSLTATLLGLLYPSERVIAVDRMHQKFMPHFEDLPNTSFFQADIFRLDAEMLTRMVHNNVTECLLAKPSIFSPAASKLDADKKDASSSPAPASVESTASDCDVDDIGDGDAGAGAATATTTATAASDLAASFDKEHDTVGVIIGMHLCGLLSEKAIELFKSHPALQGIVLSPCCLPSKHISSIVADANKAQVNQYLYWCHHLRDRLDGNLRPTCAPDPHIKSERNTVITCVKSQPA